MLRSLFIALSTNKLIRSLAERSRLGRRLSSRFVAGLSIEDAVAAALRLHAEGIAVTLDSLGESVQSEAEARASAEIYHRLLDAIAAAQLKTSTPLTPNVSLKLSQMGMEINPQFTEAIVRELVAHASTLNGFVRIDMEGSAFTEATIAMTERLHVEFPTAVGTVLQAYLFRTEADVERLLAQNIRIRLCKGAYKEPPSVAFPRKADVDANYVRLMQRLVTSATFCGIATHDERIVDQLLRFVAEQSVPKTAFEFQMLYGVRRDLQRRLAAQGFGVRVYIPFGTAWYPYFMRRLAERPANLVFLAKNLFK
jgi:proline dehydrogenase